MKREARELKRKLLEREGELELKVYDLERLNGEIVQLEVELERLRTLVKYPIVLDGRNLYDPAVMVEHGFSYYSVGRPAALTEELPAKALPQKKERA